MVQSWAALAEAEADTGATAGALAKIGAAATAVGSLEIEEEEEDEEEERSLLIQQEAETVFFFATEAIVKKSFFLCFLLFDLQSNRFLQQSRRHEIRCHL